MYKCVCIYINIYKERTVDEDHQDGRAHAVLAQVVCVDVHI